MAHASASRLPTVVFVSQQSRAHDAARLIYTSTRQTLAYQFSVPRASRLLLHSTFHGDIFIELWRPDTHLIMTGFYLFASKEQIVAGTAIAGSKVWVPYTPTVVETLLKQ